ncbi:MAG: diaminopimelate decarboxylase [Muribaculaceae bacterium]|nr:diaminopimelate decarboxylase [Muribaculaceae bacterium]
MNFETLLKNQEHLQTPCYYYDLELLRQTLDAMHRLTDMHENWHVHYAMKANADPIIMEEIRAAGLGIDAVSGGEISQALEAGFMPQSIVFAGVGKTDDEIRLALREKIACLNVESVEELEVIEHIASEMGIKAPVALRINPNIDAHTHKFITTGLEENKFGINLSLLDSTVDRVISSQWLQLCGLHFHIGSQITVARPFEILSMTINKVVSNLEKRGVKIDMIDVGGGLGVDYYEPDLNPIPDFRTYFGAFSKYLKLPAHVQVHFELGRAIVAQCGALVSRVLYVKQGISKKFAIIDGGFTELIRPALYGAHHRIENISADNNDFETYDVVGPVCESTDVFDENAILPHTERGHLLVLRTAGAYGEVMSMHYNGRSLKPTIYNI